MNNDAALLATAAAKSTAHLGLVDALDYGTTRVLRINGLDHIYADNFIVTVDINGRAVCNGYVVNSTCRDLAYGILRAARTH